jgi:hypothetical protein
MTFAQVVQQVMYNIVPFLHNAKEIVYISQINKATRKIILTHETQTKSQTYFQMYYKAAVPRFLKQKHMPLFISKILESYGAELTGSSTLQIFENKIYENSDLDFFISNETLATDLANVLLSSEDVTLIENRASANYDNSWFSKLSCSFAYKLEIKYGRLGHSLTIDILDKSKAGVEMYDLDICANTISLDVSSYQWENIHSIISRKAKYLPVIKNHIADTFDLYCYYSSRDNPDTYLAEQEMKYIKYRYDVLANRAAKYMKRGYLINGSFLDSVPQDNLNNVLSNLSSI